MEQAIGVDGLRRHAAQHRRVFSRADRAGSGTVWNVTAEHHDGSPADAPWRRRVASEITRIDGVAAVLRGVRRKYNLPETLVVVCNVALDATYTTATGLAKSGHNHGLFTWLAMPLAVKMERFVMHVSSTESARMDAALRGRNLQVIGAMTEEHFQAELESTDGDSGTAVVHQQRHVQQWVVVDRLIAFDHDCDPPWLFIRFTLFDKMRVIRAAGGFDVIRWLADVLHWLRTLRNRLLDNGHVMQMRLGGHALNRETVVEAMPSARGIVGPGLDKASSKFQDAPPIAMFSLANLAEACEKFPAFGRWLTPGVLIQAAFRLHGLSRHAVRFCGR
jgi:hypothetical protein